MATFCCNSECIKLLQTKTNRERELILEIQSLYTAIAGLTKRAETTHGSAPVDATEVDTGIPLGPPMTSLARPDLCKDNFIFKSSPARQGDFNMAYERCDVCARRVQNRMCMACKCEVCECECGCEDACECDECECSRGDHTQTRPSSTSCSEFTISSEDEQCPTPTQEKMVQGLDEAQAKLNAWAVGHVAKVFRDFNMAYERCDGCARRFQDNNRMCMACECELCECDECECTRGDHTQTRPSTSSNEDEQCPTATQEKMVKGLDEAQAKLNEWAVSHVVRVEEGNSKLEDIVSTFPDSLPDPLSPLRGPYPYLRPGEVLPPSPTSFELEWAPPQCGNQACIDLGSGNHISTCPYRIGAPPVPSSTTKSDNMWTLDGASGSVVDESTSISPPFPPLPPPDSQSYTGSQPFV
jgi:hypothetical protein